jgi:WhiB family redox-sensing transcriptional regulator
MIDVLMIPGAWADRALCAEADPDAWFPDNGQNDRATIAKRICARCPVRAECLEHALAGADTWHGIAFGIWGGTTVQERRTLRRARQAVAA